MLVNITLNIQLTHITNIFIYLIFCICYIKGLNKLKVSQVSRDYANSYTKFSPALKHIFICRIKNLIPEAPFCPLNFDYYSGKFSDYLQNMHFRV